MSAKFTWLRKVAISLPCIGLAGWLAWTSWQARAQSPAAGAASPAAGAATKVYLNKTVINLPILIDERLRPQVASVHLYVKQGAAQPWLLCDKAPPTQASFTFSAPSEGEYWFNIVSVDKAGRMTPPDISKEAPAVVAVLDTQAPQVEVQLLKAGPDGQYLRCQWRDTHLDNLKSRVFYQTADLVWHSLDSQPGQADTYRIPLQAAWNGNVRAVAVDLAGNTTTKEMKMGLSGSTTAPAALLPRTGEAVPNAIPQAALPPVAVTPPHPAPLPPSILQTNSIAADAKVAHDVPATPMPTRQRTIDVRDVVLPPLPDATPDAAAMQPPRQIPDQRPTVQGKSGPVDVIVSQKVAAPVLPTQLFDPSAAGQRRSGARDEAKAVAPMSEPASMQRQFTNATRLSLEYRIEALGASGIGKVEVWCTRDLGQTWQRLCEDTDRQSPAEVNLPGEGVYGVTLSISNGRGFGGSAPKSGDAPEMWIEVDTTKPSAKIMDIRPGDGDDSGALHIAWSARDKNLAGGSVELQYAATREGPWQSIAKGLKGEGVYRWMAPVAVGPSAYIRLTVRDQADNVAAVETPQAVPLDDASRPRGRLLGISAAQGSSNPLPIMPE